MRVLLIDVNCKYSSTGKIVYNLKKGLESYGHKAAICYGRGELIKEEGIYKFGLDWETYLHAFFARLTGLNGYFSFCSTKRLIKFIDDFNPDIVHIHELHAYFVNIKTLINYLKKKNIKIVYTFHCEYLYTGKCGHANECTKYQDKCGNCSHIHDYPKSLFFDFTKKMLKDKKDLLINEDFTIVTPSKWLQERVKSSFLKEKDIIVINNGIDCDQIFHIVDKKIQNNLREKYNLENKKIILSVAPNILSEEKGGKTIIELSTIMSNSDLHFVLIGAEHDEQISDNITILKKTKDQKELATWYSMAELFLICSKKENFPTTCLEALCCGTRIVGIDGGGTKETANAPYGLFVKNKSSLSKAIDEMLLEKASPKEISNYGYLRYSNDIMIKKYIDLYKELN